MLKLTYTENSFRLEYLSQSLEEWVVTRTLLALRSGTSLCLEPSTAAFLLPADLPYLTDLEEMIQREPIDAIELSVCDAESVEVGLQGTWLASSPDSEAGIFVCGLSDRAEAFLAQLWQDAQFSVMVVNDNCS